MIIENCLRKNDSIIPSIWDEKYLTNYGGNDALSASLKEELETASGQKRVRPVSYTHLDVYKRQE